MKILLTGLLVALTSVATAEEPKSEADHLRSIRESMQAIHKAIPDLREKELSETEIDSLLNECEHQMVGANQIQTLVLGQLLLNPNLSGKQKEKTRELLLRNLDYHWIDTNTADQLIYPFLVDLDSEEDAVISPSVKMHAEDLWTDLSPAAQRIYMSSIFSAHKKAIYFDLVRRESDLELPKKQTTEPAATGQRR